jgi:hypothetical protein
MADKQTMRNLLFILLTFYLSIFINDASAYFSRSMASAPGDTITGTPMKIIFNYGQNTLRINNNTLRIDLVPLGANYFDESTIDDPQFVPGIGWVHYIMNPAWHAVLALREPSGAGESQASYMLIHAGDESRVMPATAVADTTGTFAVASRKGVLLGTSGQKGCYLPLCSYLGLGQFNEVSLDIVAFDPDLAQRALEVHVPNTLSGGYKIGVVTLDIRELSIK